MARLESFVPCRAELKKIPSVAAGLIIIGIDPRKNGENAVNPMLWTNIDAATRKETERTAGQATIPLESRKAEESLYNNALGGIAEFCDDSNLFYVREHLWLAPDSFCKGKVMHKLGQVDLAILVYDGSLSIRFNPLSREEAIPNGWVSVQNFQSFKSVRPTAEGLVRESLNEGLLQKVVRSWTEGNRKLFVPDHIVSLKSYEDLREKSGDAISLSSRPK